MIETVQEDGLAVPIGKLCRWIGVPRRTVYDRPMKKTPVVQERLAQDRKQ